MENAFASYQRVLAMPSDIREHLPLLHRLGTLCSHITEMGTRDGISTLAFLAAAPEVLICYDIVRSASIDRLCDTARQCGTNFIFKEESTLDADIEVTELLFIDTLHTREQLEQELERHASKARRYLVLHDTETFGREGEIAGTEGLWPAVVAYMRIHQEWRLLAHHAECNGLTIFIRL